MSFQTKQDIAIDGPTHSDFVFVQFKASQSPKFAFYKDAAATIPFTEHQYVVEPSTLGAVYFWLTEDSDSGAEFPSDPCDWPNNEQPGTVEYKYMTPSKSGFSVQVDNTAPHEEDNSYSFQLKVFDGTNTHVSQVYEVDPTIVEKGDDTPPVLYEETG